MMTSRNLPSRSPRERVESGFSRSTSNWPAVLGLVAGLLTSQLASAAECQPEGGHSPCIDANALWLNPSGRFTALRSGRVLEPGDSQLGFAVSYLSRPITAGVESPDPEGREVRLLDHVLDVELHGAVAFGRNWEGSLSLPLVAYQTGSGVAGLTDQSAPPVTRAGPRDPRLGLSRQLWLSQNTGAAAHLTLTLPLGDEAALAGGSSPTLAPSIAGEHRWGMLTLGVELGLRLQSQVQLASTNYGSRGWGGLGVDVQLIEQWLSARAELLVAPLLTDDQIPAEWLLTLGSEPSDGFSVHLGGGTAVPISTNDSGDRFAGITSPRLRALLLIRVQTPR